MELRERFQTAHKNAIRKCTVGKMQASSAAIATKTLHVAAPVLAIKMQQEIDARVRHNRAMRLKLAADSTVVFSARHKDLYLKYLALDDALSFFETKKNKLGMEETQARSAAMYDDDMQTSLETIQASLRQTQDKIASLEEEKSETEVLQKVAENLHNPMWSFLVTEGWVKGVGTCATVREKDGEELKGFGQHEMHLKLPYKDEEEINEKGAKAFNSQILKIQDDEERQLKARGKLATAATNMISWMGRNLLTSEADAEPGGEFI